MSEEEYSNMKSERNIALGQIERLIKELDKAKKEIETLEKIKTGLSERYKQAQQMNYSLININRNLRNGIVREPSSMTHQVYTESFQEYRISDPCPACGNIYIDFHQPTIEEIQKAVDEENRKCFETLTGQKGKNNEATNK